MQPDTTEITRWADDGGRPDDDSDDRRELRSTLLDVVQHFNTFGGF